MYSWNLRPWLKKKQQQKKQQKKKKKKKKQNKQNNNFVLSFNQWFETFQANLLESINYK